MKEPIVTIPVLSSTSGKRKQFLSTLSLRTLLVLLASVIQRKDQGAGLRANNSAAKRIAEEWNRRGEVECIKPIVIAIGSESRFVPSEEWQHTGGGNLKGPLSNILDVCDGIQRVNAAKLACQGNLDLLKNEWPVQFVETWGDEDLALLTATIRKQTAIGLGRKRSKMFSRDAEKWSTAVIGASRFLQKAVATAKSSLAPRSFHLWTGSAVARAFASILEAGILPPDAESAKTFGTLWDRLPSFIEPLQHYAVGHASALQLREATILSQAPTFQALAWVAALALTSERDPAEAILARLRSMNWSLEKDPSSKMGRNELRESRTRLLLAHCGLDRQADPDAK